MIITWNWHLQLLRILLLLHNHINRTLTIITILSFVAQLSDECGLGINVKFVVVNNQNFWALAGGRFFDGFSVIQRAGRPWEILDFGNSHPHWINRNVLLYWKLLLTGEPILNAKFKFGPFAQLRNNLNTLSVFFVQELNDLVADDQPEPRPAFIKVLFVFELVESGE